MKFYCQTKDELINKINDWIKDMKKGYKINIVIEEDFTLKNKYILDILEVQENE